MPAADAHLPVLQFLSVVEWAVEREPFWLVCLSGLQRCSSSGRAGATRVSRGLGLLLDVTMLCFVFSFRASQYPSPIYNIRLKLLFVYW